MLLVESFTVKVRIVRQPQHRLRLVTTLSRNTKSSRFLSEPHKWGSVCYGVVVE